MMVMRIINLLLNMVMIMSMREMIFLIVVRTLIQTRMMQWYMKHKANLYQ